jgi:pimeloyl-ACP methyl ester carboxylesterase
MTIRVVVLFLTLFVTAVAAAALFAIGDSLAKPHSTVVAGPPDDLPLEVLSIPRADGDKVAAWFAKGKDGQGGILLVHGIRSDRRAMLPRARFLFEAGYSVLLIDLQAHGETPGEWITFGYRESRDVAAGVDYLTNRLGGRPVGVLGVSLGGAAALLGEAPVDVDAVVLESVYSSIERAVRNRLTARLGGFGSVLAPLLLWQIEPRLGVSPKALVPLAAIRQLDAPVMIIGGTDDRRTQPDETKAMYMLANAPKRLWLIDGARHEDLHRYAPEAYRQHVVAFLDRYLGGN